MEQNTNTNLSHDVLFSSDHAPDQAARLVRVRELNDVLRRTGQGGRVLVSDGVAPLPSPTFAAVLKAVATFTTFDAGNDPHGEHDFGAVEVEGEVYFWKIDTYDSDCIGHSPDPADPAVTTRVLTIMQGAEY